MNEKPEPLIPPATPSSRRRIGWPVVILLSLVAAWLVAGVGATVLSLVGVAAEEVFPYLLIIAFGLSLWLIRRYAPR